jgi:hypothetical protein
MLMGAIVVMTAALTTLFFSPRYWLWCFAGAPLRDVISIQPEFNRAFFALQQLHDPWQRIENLTHRVIEWDCCFRCWATISDSPTDGIWPAAPGCLAALAAVAAWTWRTTHTVLITATATLLAATSSWYFVSTGWLAYFDSWLIACIGDRELRERAGFSSRRPRWRRGWMSGSFLRCPFVRGARNRRDRSRAWISRHVG